MSLLGEALRQAGELLLGGDREIWGILWLSLRVSATATAIALALGIPSGALLALTRFSGRGLVVSAVNTGMGPPPVVVGPSSASSLAERSLGGWESSTRPRPLSSPGGHRRADRHRHHPGGGANARKGSACKPALGASRVQMVRVVPAGAAADAAAVMPLLGDHL